MFERNKIDTTQHKHTVAVELTMSDGTVLKGNLAVPRSKSLPEALNGPQAFVEFELFDGEACYISKQSLHALRELKVPGQVGLAERASASSGFDPYAVLGLHKGASARELRKAYHKLSLDYHPDRYATAELPDEVKAYLESMARRINTAYDMLSDEAAENSRLANVRTEPVYESRRPG